MMTHCDEVQCFWDCFYVLERTYFLACEKMLYMGFSDHIPIYILNPWWVKGQVPSLLIFIVGGVTKPRISKMLNVQESQKTWLL